MADELSYQDAQPILAKLSGANIVLVGGQALNFWAEQFLPIVPELAAEGPYTSKDIDFCGDKKAVRDCARRLEGRQLLPQAFDPTVNTGKVIFKDNAGVTREIDFLGSVFGLKTVDVFKTGIPVYILGGNAQSTEASLLVMHPVRCMMSRVCNTMGLSGYQTDHARKQLRASVLCAGAFLQHLLQAGHVRDVLRNNERIFKFCYHNHYGQAVAAKTGIDPFTAVLVGDGCPKISMRSATRAWFSS